jgi:hypothetical protein
MTDTRRGVPAPKFAEGQLVSAIIGVIRHEGRVATRSLIVHPSEPIDWCYVVRLLALGEVAICSEQFLSPEETK